MNTDGRADAVRKMKAGVRSWRRFDFPQLFRRIARSHPCAVFMFGARKLFFGTLFLVVVAIMLYFLSLR